MTTDDLPLPSPDGTEPPEVWSDNELTIALLDLRTKIANAPAHWIIRNTLRHKAMQLAAAFVDPTFEIDNDPPPLRNGKVMSQDIDAACGF